MFDEKNKQYGIKLWCFFLENLKFGLIIEIKVWKFYYGKVCNQKYSMEMERIFIFIEDFIKRLFRFFKDFDDIRFVMVVFKEIRDDEIRIDMLIGLIEVS